MMKRCAACKDTKHLEEFSRRAASPDGRYSYCRGCVKKAYDAAHTGQRHLHPLDVAWPLPIMAGRCPSRGSTPQ